jgi:hypothetical protein
MKNLARDESGTKENVDVSQMPYRRGLRTWAGHGTGATCNGCGGSIKPSEIEYEVEVPPEPGSDVQTLHFHLVCYGNWTWRKTR